MIGRTLGGATVSMIQGTLVIVICLIAGFRPQHVSSLPMAVLFMAFIAIVFAALGTTIGSRLQNMQGFQLIMNFLVMPIYLPVGSAVSAEQPAGRPQDRHANRSADLRDRRPSRRVHRSSHFSTGTNAAIMSVVAVVFLALGARSFAKIQI